MIRKTILLSFFLCSILIIHASPVDQERAIKTDIEFYFERSGGQQFTVTIIEPRMDINEVVYYIIQGGAGQGYVIISGDDAVYPVLGYALTGSYHPNSEVHPPAFSMLMEYYRDQIVYHISQQLPPTPEAIVAWNHYCTETNLFQPNSFQSVSPLLGQIEWGQGCNFNQFCPVDSTIGAGYCYRVPVGCVATAMVQVMKYWGHPAQGTGSHSYIHPTYGIQSANFGNTNYSWSSMPDQLSSPHTAISEISYHAAVSVDMSFGPTGSGANTGNARNSLVAYFDYSPSAYYTYNNVYSDSIWGIMIRSDLDSARPIIYRGSDALNQNGHAFILDGYQGSQNDHYHINWGWSGYHNGYFYLSSLTPGSYNFSYNRAAIFNLKPNVTNPPVADFSATPQTAYTQQTIQFTDLSSNSPISHRWFFGDGDSSHLPNPTHSYTTPGTYDVMLIVANNLGSDTLTKPGYIAISSLPLPVADFYASPNSFPVGSATQFTDISTHYPTAWLWDFGDGQTSTQQHPLHTYQYMGNYTVKLVVWNANGSDSITKPGFITVTGAPPPAAFSATPLIAYPGDTIHFTDESTNAPGTWHWNFGDGDTSDLQHPWHIYTSPGVYDVTLRAYNSYGYTELFKQMYIYITPLPPLPTAYFAGIPTTILAGQTVTFTDYSPGHPFAWEWNFPGGDPGFSHQQDPGSIQYNAPGHYDVSLVVHNLSGSDTLIRDGYVVVGSPGIEEFSGNKIILWPIPVSHELYISSPQPITQIHLYDIAGRQTPILSENGLLENQISVNLSKIPPGVYQLDIYSEEGRQTRKILIAR